MLCYYWPYWEHTHHNFIQCCHSLVRNCFKLELNHKSNWTRSNWYSLVLGVQFWTVLNHSQFPNWDIWTIAALPTQNLSMVLSIDSWPIVWVSFIMVNTCIYSNPSYPGRQREYFLNMVFAQVAWSNFHKQTTLHHCESCWVKRGWTALKKFSKNWLTL